MISYQLKALLWRNFLIRFRSWGGLVLELGFPVMFCLLLEIFLVASPSHTVPEKIFPTRPVEDFTKPYTGKLFFLPSTPATLKLMTEGAGFETPHAQAVLDKKLKYGNLVAMLQFENKDEVPRHLKFQVITSRYDDHYENGVIFIQYAVTKFFINYWQKQPHIDQLPSKEKFYIQMLPRPATSVSARRVTLQILETALPYMLLGLVSLSTMCVVLDKEKNVQDFLKVFSVKAKTFWLSWLLTCLAIGLCTAMAVSLVLCVEKRGGGLVLLVNPVLYLSLLTFYLVNVISYSFLVSCLVSKARNAFIISGAVFLLTRYSAPTLQQYIKSRYLAHAAACVFFHTGAIFFDMVFANERQEKHLNLMRLIAPYDPSPHLTMLDSLAMMATNAAFNFSLVWYLENARLGRYGQARNQRFAPFTLSYWLGNTKSSIFLPIFHIHNYHNCDPTPLPLTAIIQIQDLVKIVDGPKAILGTDLDVYQDQLTVLVGPEESGKSTILNLIAGLVPASGGHAYVDGYDINTHPDATKASIGLCPQSDVVFEQMTCGEHLQFYAMLRNCSHRIAEETEDVLNPDDDIGTKTAGAAPALDQFGLDENVYCKALSKSDRRKLSIACSFVGDCRVILLDDPFEVLDSLAKRDVLKFLQSKREGRAIMLTTQHVDVAEEVGNRIILLVNGLVKSYGTLPYLTHLYGIGYHINVAMDTDYDFKEIKKIVKEIIPSAAPKMVNDFDLDISVAEEISEKLPAMLEALEANKNVLKILNVGVTSLWLKDVYTRLCVGLELKLQGDSEASEIPDDKSGEIESSEVDFETKKERREQLSSVVIVKKVAETIHFHHLRHFPLLVHQMKAIFTMKALMFLRGKQLSLLQICFPFAFTVIGMIADGLSGSDPTDTDPRYFTLAGGGGSADLVFPVVYEQWDPAKIVMKYIKEIHDVHGVIEEYKYSNSSVNISFEDFANRQLLRWAEEHSVAVYNELFQFGLLKLFHSSYVIVLYRNTTNHSIGIAMQLAMDAWVKCSLGEGFSVQSGVYLFPRPYEDMTDRFPRRWTTFLMLSISMALVPLSFMYSLVVERASGAKQLESLSGARPYDYWRGHFLFDILIYNMMVAPQLLALVFSGVGSDQAWLTVIIFTVFGFTMITYLYALQFFFLKPMVAVFVLFMTNVVIGILLSGFVVSSSFKGRTSQAFIYFVGATVSISTPNFSLTGFIYLLTLQPSSFEFPRAKTPIDASTFFCHPVNFIYYLLFQLMVSWTVVTFFEFKLDRLIGNHIRGLSPITVETDDSPVDFVLDDDVKELQERMESAHKSELTKTYSLAMKGLGKKYSLEGKVFTAVHNFSFGLMEMECLGLLGPKDAGKTTVCQMITGEISITSGSVFMHGLNILKHAKRTQSMIGYCPQHDDVPDQLTGREALYMFARLTGVPDNVINQNVLNVIELTSLSPYEDQLIRSYSSEFKRRISVAIAIIGPPKFIVLDEPTAGLDPAARQTLWTVFETIRASGKTLVLATRSYEECEAVCTHVVVMVKGHMVCVGSPEHLKSKYSEGHIVTLHASPDDKGGFFPLSPAQKFVLNTFENSKIFAKNESYVDILVPDGVSLPSLFEQLENALRAFSFQRYRVRESSFQQILLKCMKSE